MRIHIVACRILARELSALAATSPNMVDITWLARGLHNTPTKLRDRIVETLDDIYAQIDRNELEFRPDYIVLGYGLCSNGVVGVECRDIPIVVPRTDDCIALFLGSQQRYMKEFAESGGAYWLNSGWLEHSARLFDEEDFRRRRWLEYAEKYGEENADYLIEVESSWMNNYSTLGFIHSSVYERPEYLPHTAREAQKHNWQLREVNDDLRMLRMMVNGDWNENEFLILEPGERIAADYAGAKLKAEPAPQPPQPVSAARPSNEPVSVAFPYGDAKGGVSK